MEIIGSKITHKRLWAGHSFHPFLQTMDIELKKLDFLFDGFDARDRSFGSANWVSPLFPGYKALIEITSQNRDLIINKSNIYINCTFRIESSLQYLVNPMLKIHSTGRNSRDLIGLEIINWLTKNWSPKSPDAWKNWVDIAVESSEEAARRLIFFISKQGLDFFRFLNSPQLLANSLLGVSQPNGNNYRLLSGIPEICAIIALLSGGFRNECVAPLCQYKKDVDDRRVRMIDNDTDHQTCLNRIQLLETWIQTPSGVGIEKYVD